MIQIIDDFARHLSNLMVNYAPDGETSMQYVCYNFDALPKSRYLKIEYTGNYELIRKPDFMNKSYLSSTPETDDKFEYVIICDLHLIDTGNGEGRFYNGIMEAQLKLATLCDIPISFSTGGGKGRAMITKLSSTRNKFETTFTGKMDAVRFDDVYELRITYGGDSINNVQNRTNET